MGCNKCLQNISCLFYCDQAATVITLRITIARLQFLTVVTAEGSLESVNIFCTEFLEAFCFMGLVTAEKQAEHRHGS